MNGTLLNYDQQVELCIRAVDRERLKELQLTPGQEQHAKAKIILALAIDAEIKKADKDDRDQEVKTYFAQKQVYKRFKYELNPIVQAYLTADTGTAEEYGTYIQKLRKKFSYFNQEVMDILLFTLS